ncbi:hypothetical protein GJ697_14720 [Pseudoduganella sp. FT25W]|jgi:hypothetical protein|uniref:Uncharacterized protein n=1 Tax=Duganella alba TaxID=2666081 RepID=A0A6L5QIK9_9BURK|nr:hypothetical protein [Duganella alba]MRX09092.1 hypothetical protein [Duganella alba]MRX15631.1 hypothetical protein [Duganella alba]
MDNEDERRRFISELWQRFEQLQAWAVENWPDKDNPLSSADFVESRKEILGLRNPAQAPGGSSSEREPEQGGAQYIDLNPAPWP